MTNDWSELKLFDSSPETILANRRAGLIYVADFKNNNGQYVSSVIDSMVSPDAVIKITPKIEVRITYIISHDKIEGLQLSKLNIDKTIDSINLTSMDWEGILKLLHVFSSIDIKSMSSGNLLLDASLIGDQKKLSQFLNTVAADPQGREKFAEIATNFNLLKPGEVDNISYRKAQVELMRNLLNNQTFFSEYKKTNSIGKSEEVWQRFFGTNSWILGSDFIEILGDRALGEDKITDLPVKGYDGFLDVIELKLPTTKIWNLDVTMSSDLVKPIMQCMNYLVEYEKKMNEADKLEKLGADILKPRISLLIGRTLDWKKDHHRQFRILNSSFHNISILTYDHVLERAQRIINQSAV